MSALQLTISEKYPEESRFYSKENLDVLLQSVKELGGRATKREIIAFLWAPENKEKFKRPRGRAWSDGRTQHDLFGLCLRGDLWLDKLHGFTYYLSPEVWGSEL